MSLDRLCRVVFCCVQLDAWRFGVPSPQRRNAFVMFRRVAWRCNIHTTERATLPRCQVQLASEKVPHAHNSQYVEQQTGSTIFPLFKPFKASARCSKTSFILTMPKVSATLDALNHDSMKDHNIYDKLQAVGGWSALDHLTQNGFGK
jgi:hypothetical protein